MSFSPTSAFTAWTDLAALAPLAAWLRARRWHGCSTALAPGSDGYSRATPRGERTKVSHGEGEGEAALAGRWPERPIPGWSRFESPIQGSRGTLDEDIRGSRAHVAMLAAQGVVPRAVANGIAAGLNRVRGRESAAGEAGSTRRWRTSSSSPWSPSAGRAGGGGTPATSMRAARPRPPGGPRRAALARARLESGQSELSLMRALLGQARAPPEGAALFISHLQRAQPNLPRPPPAGLPGDAEPRSAAAGVSGAARPSHRSVRVRWRGPR